jgi:hypothetical protein
LEGADRGYNTTMRRSAALLGLLAVSLVATATSGGALAPNVRGIFVRGPHVVGCYPSEPCDQPPAAGFLLFRRDGHATRVRLGANGAFAVRLASGLYRVSVVPAHGTTVSPATLRVPAVGVVHPHFVQRTTSLPAPG